MIVLGQGFSGNYDEYFGLGTDCESVNYLMLANHMLHKFYPSFMMTIAEVCLLKPYIDATMIYMSVQMPHKNDPSSFLFIFSVVEVCVVMSQIFCHTFF